MEQDEALAGEQARIKEVELDCLKWKKDPADRKFKIKAFFRKEFKLRGTAVLISTMNAGTEGLGAGTANVFHDDATAEIGVVSGPPWWTGVDECEYNDVPAELSRKIEEWTVEFQEILKKN